MATNYQKLITQGYLGSDAKFAYTPGGEAVLTFNLANNQAKKQADGNYKDEALWFICEIWGREAERYAEANTLTKGSFVLVEGRLRIEQWLDSEGFQQVRLKIKSQAVVLLKSKSTSLAQEVAADLWDNKTALVGKC